MKASPIAPTLSSPTLVPNSSKTWRFYLILFSLSFICFVAALDGSIIATALPKIANELSATNNYVWIANSFLVAQTVIQPLCAQLCNIFGRRMPMLISISVFALGSGIAGRTVQGLGSGGIMMLVELIICDLVPLRERGKYLDMVLSSSAVAAILGPVVGGALSLANWRWIFYLNIPISGITLAVMSIFLRLRHEREPTWMRALSRVDWVGNIIFVASLCSLLIGLVFGGLVYAWSSWKVILPIVVGVLGWIGFHIYEWRPPAFCKEVSIPPRIFATRTSAAGFYIDFISSVLLQWALKGAFSLRAGIDFIPYEAFLIVTAAVAGWILSKFGHYRPLHLLGFCLSILGPGLNISLSSSTPKAVWVVFQMIDAIGRALLLPTVLPAIMASLPDSDVAVATGMYSFLRSFGFVWGITIPGIIFNSQFDRYLKNVSDATVRQQLGSGRAYQLVSSDYIRSLDPIVQQEVISVYRRALRPVWIGAVAFGFTGLITVFVEKHIALRTELDTEYGIEGEISGKDEEKLADKPEVRGGGK
ncbi:MFS general substrate transporter [Mollisia scopiformis]|uniref:MFS general substrate transporter n=1 Tax=Mollisia scopiformis TaxID=149040 RepID=A0A194XH32_MOLSC|nr:MFS general substrate transporter [Mollisia scopiformis]KUJ19473.1 MFS general substrate transporter [Mollisia scopiformis]